MGAFSSYDYYDQILNSEYAKNVTKVVTEGKITCYGDFRALKSVGLFEGLTNLTDISGLASWDVSNVSNFSYLFENCNHLSNMTPLKNWNVANVTDFSCMFCGCSAMSDLSFLQNWNTQKMTTMKEMFSGCATLKDLTALSSWKIGKVTNMTGLFSGCTSLVSASGLKSWSTNKLQSATSMFSNCTSLTDIADLGSWDTSSLSDVSQMFAGCTKLANVSALYAWSGKNLGETRSVFEGCTSLEDGCVFRDWGFDGCQVAESLFKGCNGLSSVDFTFLNKATSSQQMNATSVLEGCESKMIRSFKLPNSKDKFMNLDSLPDNNPLDVSYIQTLYEGSTFRYSLGDGTKINSLKDLINGWDTHNLSGQTVLIGSDQVVSVTFESNGGTEVENQEFPVGSCATKPADPTKTYYNFKGWYLDAQLKNAYDFNKKVTSNITLYAKWAVVRVTMHRLYNPFTGEHFYTSDSDEKKRLINLGWKDEKVGWIAPAISSKPVYRLYNKYVPGGDHHYTTRDDEVKECEEHGWILEGTGWYSDTNEEVPVYRQYNPNAITGAHNYTTDKSENDGLVRIGWRGEGVSWYGLA